MPGNEPITYTMALGIESSALDAVGAIDVTLNCDTNLFIDPLLLEEAGNLEFRECATASYVTRFEQIIDLLSASKAEGDAAWRAARKQLSFHEVSFTHLGYSAGINGSGFGTLLTDGLISTAKEVVELGVVNPDLFLALALFEDGVGADRISDMSTNIILPCLAAFTAEACGRLGIELRNYKIQGSPYALPPNPLKPDEPVILVPKDIVRDLPVAADWDAVGSAARETEELRNTVNERIGEIWRAKTKRDKRAMRDNALRSKSAFDTLIDLLRRAADEPYDLENDHRGEIYPADLRRKIAETAPLDLKAYAKKALTIDEVDEVVKTIIDKFQSLIEDNGIWKELWNDDFSRARLEKAMQRLFFAVASAYCEANNLDLSPEANAGAGPVDFKVSAGAAAKVVVELKRSMNPKLVDGYTKQLEAYKIAEGTDRGHYVVIDVGGLSSVKTTGLTLARSEAMAASGHASEIHYIDGSPQKSASKR